MKTSSLFKSLCALFLFFLINEAAYGQGGEDPNKAQLLHAIKLMDNGQVDSSVVILKNLLKLDPDSYMYNYELAYAYFLKKDYRGTIALLEKLKHEKNANDLLFQLLGNSYDMSGNPEKAVLTYTDGLIKYPNSGKLYLESAIMHLKKNDVKSGLASLEKGIAVEPAFPSNYYWASKIWMGTPEKIWGLMYGEIFMNLESNSKRTAEISKLLFDTYKRHIQFAGPGSLSVSLSKNNVVSGNNTNPDKLMPYGPFVYERLLLVSALGLKEININTLDTIRTNFVGEYFKGKTSTTYPNVLFSHQKRIAEAGHMEGYNHWLLQKGDEELFKKWAEVNQEKFTSFLKWFSANRLVLDANNRFSLSDYL